MTKKQLTKALTEILERCPNTAFFLEGVQAAIEDLYSDDPEGCPEGFQALDTAVQCFDAAEEEGDDDDDDDDEG